MSDGNRLLFTALGIIALIALGIGWFTWPSTPTLADYGEANPRNGQYTPGGSQCEPTTLAAIVDRRERLRKADACAKEAEDYRQNAADLIQQTRAADAAQSQADIASQQLWAGWFQTLGGFLTLCAAVAAAIYARDAAKEGKRSADLQNDELTETRKVTAAQLRPYVNFTDAGEDEAAPFNRQSKLKIRIKNFGQVPARTVRFNMGEKIVTEPIGDTEIPLGVKYGDLGLLAPGDGRSDAIGAQDFELEDLAIIAAGEATLALRLRVDYTWADGADFHEIIMILNDPNTNKWGLVDERRRLNGPL